MTRPSAPPRWLDHPEALPAPLSAALDAYQDRAPTAAQRDALLAALEGQLSAAGTGIVQTRGPTWIWISAALGGLAVMLAVHVSTPAARAPQTGRSAPAAQAASTPASAAVAAEPPPAAGAMEIPASELHANEPPASEARAPSRASRRRASSIASDPSAELALLTAARRVLASAPTRSLELTAEHARRFPRGSFAEERDLLRIEALLQRGERAAAARRARRFRLAYPQSAHSERLIELFTP